MLFVKVAHSVVCYEPRHIQLAGRDRAGSTQSALFSTAHCLSLPVLRNLSRPTDSGYTQKTKRQTDMSEQSRYFSSEYLKP